MAATLRELSWTPRRRDHIYCSPACGGRCTFNAYIAAKNAAQKLAARLGKGWKSHVWENLGWHWKVQRGQLEVRPSGVDSTYYARFGDEWTFQRWPPRYFKDPKRAVALQLGHATRIVAQLQRVLAEAKGQR